MKRILFILGILIVSQTLWAQSEVNTESFNSSEFQHLLFDFTLPDLPQLPMLDTYQPLRPDAAKDYSIIFQPDTRWTFGQKHTLSPTTIHSGFYSTPKQLQQATYKVNDQMRLSLYGQYSLDGKRIPGSNVFPWDKNEFVGGMEMKFNKNFGVRVEVRQGGRNPMYPYP